MEILNSFYTLIKYHFTIRSIKLVLDILRLFSVYLSHEFVLLSVMIEFGYILIRYLSNQKKLK
jgi:hypothetical protein